MRLKGKQKKNTFQKSERPHDMLTKAQHFLNFTYFK